MGSSAEYVAHVPTCVLALGDVHGDLQQAEAALRLVGATNETGEWAAGSCTLVQTGDLVDRGPDSFAVLQRFDALAAEAAEAGGAVVTLLGNHELFSLQGVLHYVHPRELHALGQHASEGGRAEDLLHSVPAAFRHAVQQRQGMQQVGAAVWAHAMGPEGWAGRLLRSRKTIAVVGEGACRTLFVHAGLLPDALALFSASAETDGGQAGGSSTTGADLVDRVNAGVGAELARCDGAHACPVQDADKRVHWLFGSNGVFWTRDYAMQREGQVCGRLQAVLDAVGAKQAVSGHTVQASGTIGTRCGLPPHLYLIDVGISRSYQGGMGAWKCVDGQVTIV